MAGIVEILNRAGAGFCGFAWTMLLQAGALIVLLYLVDLLIRKRVRAVVRYGMWMLVFVKLVLPPTLCLPTGIGYWCGVDTLRPERVVPVESEAMGPQYGAEDVQAATAAQQRTVRTEAAGVADAGTYGPRVQVGEREVASVGAAGRNVSISWEAAVFVGWVVGVAVLSVLLFQRYLFVRGLIAQSEMAGGRVAETLRQCAQEVGVRGEVQLRLCKNMLSPAACGLVRPVILMPGSLLEGLSREKLRAVLVHELAHLKRGDLWVNFAQTALQIVYFYNPLLWFANGVVRRIREKAVDEMVLTRLGGEAKSYSDILIDVAETAFSRAHFSLRLVGVVESKKALAGRIRHILGRPLPKSAKVGLAGLAAIVICGALLLPMAKAADESGAYLKKLDGATIEILGVCDYPSGGKAWWRPDGSRLGYRIVTEDKSGYTDKNKVYEIAYKVDAPNDVTVGWPKIRGSSSQSGLEVVEPAGVKVWRAHINVWGNSTTVEIPIATGEWKTLGSSSGGGQVTAAVGKRKLMFSPAVGTKEKLVITVTDDLGEFDDYRLVAVDKQGGVHTGERMWFSQDNIRQNTFTFANLDPESVERFEFETRPFEWVTFKNVSLKAGFTTDVEAEVENSGVRVEVREPNEQVINKASEIADAFMQAVDECNYSFLSAQEISRVRHDILDFAVRYVDVGMSDAEFEALAAGVKEYRLRHVEPDDSAYQLYCSEVAYFELPDQVNTFKWLLWQALTRKPLSPGDVKRRETQHEWLREFIKTVPVRPGDYVPEGIGRDEMPEWAENTIEREFANPLSLLSEPMTDEQFDNFKEWMRRSSSNGLTSTVSDIHCRALGARAHKHTGVEGVYGYPFDIELPFKDEVISTWGGAEAHLVFASNARFRGKDGFMDARGHSVFDVTSLSTLLVESEGEVKKPEEYFRRWAEQQNKGDLAYIDTEAKVITLRGGKLAALKAANWFEADQIGNDELREAIDRNGQIEISVENLPPMNGPFSLDKRVFIAVETAEEGLAVLALSNREFGQLYLRCRARDVKPAKNAASVHIEAEKTSDYLKNVKFMIIDAVSQEPLRNRELNICEFVYFKLEPGAPSPYLNRNAGWHIKTVKTDNEGAFSLNLSSIRAMHIVVEAGPPYRYVNFLRSSDMSHTPSADHIRVVRCKPGTTEVAGNYIYDLKDKQLTVMYVADGPSETSSYDEVVLEVNRNEVPQVSAVEIEAENESGDPETNLISYWDFDGDAKDRVGGNDGTVYGAVLTEGVSGQGYYFEGDGDCVSIPDSKIYDFGDGDFSISLWFKTGYPIDHFLMNFRQNDNNPHIELYVNESFGTHLLPGFARMEYPYAGVRDNKWHHAVVTLANGVKEGYKLYLDGMEVCKATYVGKLQDWDTITIGGRNKESKDGFKGAIDEVGVYSGALSAAEVRRLYEKFGDRREAERQSSNERKGLICHLDFEGNAVDKVGGIQGETNGVVLVDEGVSGKCYYFEGDGDCISLPNSPVFDFGEGDFTISAWFRTNVNKSAFIMNFRQNDYNPHIELYAGVDVGSQLAPVGTRLTYAQAGVDDDKWHHVAITMQNGTKAGYRLYLDGLKVADANYVGRLADWDDIIIGAQRKGGDDQFAFKGFIDEVCVYRTALSAAEVKEQYEKFSDKGEAERQSSNGRKGLICYWDFEGDAVDKVGGIAGETNGVVLVDGGVNGKCYYFEGDGDCISIPDSAVFDFDAGDLTISAWFRTNANKAPFAPFPFIVNFRQNDNNPHIELYESVDVGSHVAPGETRLTYTEAGVDDDKWHHVAITLDNGAEDGYRLYLDGSRVAKATYTGRLADWDTITIGAQRKGGDGQFAFKGFIDEVGIYNVALSDQEIRDIYGIFRRAESTQGDDEVKED